MTRRYTKEMLWNNYVTHACAQMKVPESARVILRAHMEAGKYFWHMKHSVPSHVTTTKLSKSNFHIHVSLSLIETDKPIADDWEYC